VLSAALYPSARRLFAGDRAKLGRQTEGVEAKREQHVLAAGPAEARVRIPDRIAAYVPNMDVPRGERGRGLYVLTSPIPAYLGGAERVALLPRGLATDLDCLRVIAGEIVVAHATENTQGTRRIYRGMASGPVAMLVRHDCKDSSMEVEIGRGKQGRRAYGFDDIAIVPSRRTRDPDDIDISWKLGPYQFELPMMASAMDGVVSPETAAIVGRLGGLAVLNLEGIFTRYEDAAEQLERIARLPKDVATREMQEIYSQPVIPELIAQRIREIKEQKVVVAASLTPQRVLDYHELALEAGLDVLVIQGTVVSGEHVSTVSEPLNLKEFIPSLDVPVVVGGCASYQTGLHLMRTGAAGVLVGVGPGAACTTRGVLGIGVPQATAIADVAHARSTHMLETGEYCQVIADGGMRNGGDVSKAIALGADAVMIGSPLARAHEAPGRGFHWGMATFHPTLPRGARVATTRNGTLEEILVGPARENDGTFNLFGGLRTSMATCGHKDLAEFNRAEVVIAPSLQTEGKQLQREQSVGMGSNGKAAELVND